MDYFSPEEFLRAFVEWLENRGVPYTVEKGAAALKTVGFGGHKEIFKRDDLHKVMSIMKSEKGPEFTLETPAEEDDRLIRQKLSDLLDTVARAAPELYWEVERTRQELGL